MRKQNDVTVYSTTFGSCEYCGEGEVRVVRNENGSVICLACKRMFEDHRTELAAELLAQGNLSPALEAWAKSVVRG